MRIGVAGWALKVFWWCPLSEEVGNRINAEGARGEHAGRARVREPASVVSGAEALRTAFRTILGV